MRPTAPVPAADLPTSTLDRSPAVRLCAVLAVTLLLAGCADATSESSAGSSTPAPSQSTSTGPDDTPSMPEERTSAEDGAGLALQRFVGELGGSDIEGGCVWLDAEDGNRYELIADARSSVVIDPGNILIADQQGNVLARSGDQVEVQGVIDEGLMTFCQVGVNLVISEVSAR